MNRVVEWFEYAQVNGVFHFFCFRLEKLFLGKFGPKNVSLSWNS